MKRIIMAGFFSRLFGGKKEEEEISEWEVIEFPRDQFPRSKDWILYKSGSDISVAGFNRRTEDWQKFIDTADPDEECAFVLRKDPKNPHDKNAIKVLCVNEVKGLEFHIGFIPKETASYLASQFPSEMPLEFELLRTGVHRENGSRFLAINMLIPSKKVRTQNDW